MRRETDAQATHALDRADVRVLAADVGLENVAESLQQIARWGLRLDPLAGEPEPGSSKVGGLPELSAGQRWPQSADARSLFVAQMAVDDVPAEPFGLAEGLDGAALLSFFAFEHNLTSEVVGGRVLMSPVGEALERVSADEPTQRVVRDQRAVTLRPELTLPAWGSAGAAALRDLGLAQEDRDAYGRLVAALEQAQGGESRHCLLGHPDRVRDDVLQEAALMEAWGEDAEHYSSETLEARAEDWRLLLRVDSEGGHGVSWPGGGSAYFCIPADALREGRYELVRAFSRAPRGG